MAVQSLVTFQPGKALWTLFALTVNLARLPLWLVYYIPRSLRQSPAYTWRQAVRIRILRAFVWNASVVRMHIPMDLAPGPEGDRYSVFSAAPSKHLVGPLVSDPATTPVQVGATWYPARPSASSAKPGIVVLHFHGGAYAIGDGRTRDAGAAASTLLRNTSATHVLAPQYRLVTSPNGRFPAQIQDAVAAYVHLLSLGVPASHIVVSGDSAGGNLALGLVRYLADHGAAAGLDSPGAAWLWSPWPSPHNTITDTTGWSRSPNTVTDYITSGFGEWGANLLAPSRASGLTLDNPYVNFIGHPIKTTTPIFVSVGSLEVLLHDVVKMYEATRKVDGNRIDIDIVKDAPHDIILTSKIIGFEDKAAESAKAAGRWLDNIVSGSAQAKI